MNKEVTLTIREQKRLFVFNKVLAGELTGQEAAEMLGLSLRHTRRLLSRYRSGGAATLAHQSRGQVSPRRTSPAIAALVGQLAGGDYRDYNDSHFRDELAEKHNIKLSRSTVRRLRRAAGYGSPQKRRAPRHRRRRRRYPQAGMLLQIDGSRHDWLEGRGPWLSLVLAIDDATSEVVAALFREQEDATGYVLLLHQLSQSHGLPLALYADRHTIFQSPKEATIPEQLLGLEPRTQFGHLLAELEIELIPAYSPQAKGRVERVFRTLQDRLVKALRQEQATTLAEANKVLRRYLSRHNQRFAQPAAEAQSAFRVPLTQRQANEQCCFIYYRTVAKDHTLAFWGHTLQLPPQPRHRQLPGQPVQLRHRMDGRLWVYAQGKRIATFDPLTLGPPLLEQFTPHPRHLAPPKPDPTAPLSKPPNGQHKVRKPAPDHPWRRGFYKRMKQRG